MLAKLSYTLYKPKLRSRIESHLTDDSSAAFVVVAAVVNDEYVIHADYASFDPSGYSGCSVNGTKKTAHILFQKLPKLLITGNSDKFLIK